MDESDALRARVRALEAEVNGLRERLRQDEEGGPTTTSDREARHRAEAQLRQAQKMEAIGSLAGGVAHDFNNLLSVILSYATLALDDLPPDAALRDDLGEIREAAERASCLTRQLLAFSRQQVLEPRLISVNDCVAGVQRMLSRLLGEHIVQHIDLAPDLPTVHADPGQLEQVLMNLAVNARDAMPRGGVLTVDTRVVEIGADAARAAGDLAPGRYARLRVRDTGCGMDEATRARALEPFFTTKGVGRGTGLGLSTVFGIVVQTRGHLSIESAPGEGTCIDVLLPAADACVTPTPAPAARPLPATEGNETVLLVEDDSAVRRIVSTILRREGYQVLEAADGEMALRLSRETRAAIDLLLTDVVMPHMNGRVLAERLKAKRPAIRVLYMSGYAQEMIGDHGIQADHTPLVQKPIIPARLAAKVREALS